MGWYWVEQGTGRPLILLHGLGQSSEAWAPIMARLAAERRVIAFDLPGFGRTPPLPAQVPPTPAGYASLLPQALLEAGVDEQPGAAGHSMGGWIALEAAKAGTVRSVVALSPSGLWPDHMPTTARRRLLLDRWMVRRWPRLTRRVLSTTAGRTLATFGLYGRPWAVPATVAVQSAFELGSAPGFDAALDGQARERFRDGEGIQALVTVAFGTRDTLLGKNSARLRDQLPGSHRWLKMPRCGHEPTWDDPAMVAQVILDGTHEPDGSGSGRPGEAHQRN